MNEPAPYNWREHWKETTRGGYEVVDVRPFESGRFSYVFIGNNRHLVGICNSVGCRHAQPSVIDLLPIEPKEKAE